MEKKVRMADAARELGISIVSMSKALAGKDGISEEMRSKILALTKEMGDVPLRSKPGEHKQSKSGSIGILLMDQFFGDNTFYSNMYRQLVMSCNEHGYSAMLELVTPDAKGNHTVPAMIQ